MTPQRRADAAGSASTPLISSTFDRTGPQARTRHGAAPRMAASNSYNCGSCNTPVGCGNGGIKGWLRNQGTCCQGCGDRYWGEWMSDPPDCCDPILCERMLQRLLERGARPRFAFIEVAPEGLNERTAWLGMYVGWVLCWETRSGMSFV